MELTHKLTYNNTTKVINEPIGWDDLKMTMKRHDYHGMGAEVSMGDLEFYGAAFNIIKTAYDADIDSVVIYAIMSGSTTIYSGQVDLTTCSFERGDYESVKVKVGEVGVMTTFNNRTKTDIDLSAPKTVDGDTIDTPSWLSLHIPMKHLLYTNILKSNSDLQTTEQLTPDQYYHSFGHFAFSLGEKITEFGSIESQFVSVESGLVPTDLSNPFYIEPEDFVDNFGANTTKHIEGTIKINLSGTATTSSAGTLQWGFYLYAKNGTSFTQMVARGGNLVYAGSAGTTTFNTDAEINFGEGYEFDSPDQHGSSFYAVIDIFDNGRVSSGVNLTVKVKKESTIKMTMYDNLTEESVNADMLLVHDALNIVSHAISENALSVKSNWFRTPESHWNSGAIQTKENGGNGAHKALTNGYKIRGLYTDAANERNMPVSFKALIEALDALDCIGWGFSTEDNVLYLRVERWDWFYNETTILTLTNVAEVTTDVYTDYIPTELKIGYKKYATQDQYNSINSPHGTRTFTSGIKALAKTLTKECEFVADNYAIEETRRARTQVSDTEETTYDENIFIFELMRTQRAVSIGDIGNLSATYSIPHSAKNPTGVGNASEFINAKLTPRHMAARWRDFLFSTNNSTPFRFTSGEINYKSSFATHPEADMSILVGGSYLDSFAVTSPQAENDDISYSHAKFKAEKITFTCPLSIAQYNTVKANPYGLVSVNGTLGWIMDFKYSLHDGTADFTLLAKYVTNN